MDPQIKDMGLSSKLWADLRVPLAALAALAVVLIGIFSILAWKSSGQGRESGAAKIFSEEQKLQILATLRGGNSLSESQRQETLGNVSPSTALEPSKEEKLKILQSLHNK